MFFLTLRSWSLIIHRGFFEKYLFLITMPKSRNKSIGILFVDLQTAFASILRQLVLPLPSQPVLRPRHLASPRCGSLRVFSGCSWRAGTFCLACGCPRHCQGQRRGGEERAGVRERRHGCLSLPLQDGEGSFRRSHLLDGLRGGRHAAAAGPARPRAGLLMCCLSRSCRYPR